VSVLLGNGNGTFQTQQTFSVGSNPWSVALSDVNADNKPDIVTANNGSHDVSVLLGNGDGTFQAQQTFGVGNGPYSVALADVNGDNKTDIVTANGLNYVMVLLNTTVDNTPPKVLWATYDYFAAQHKLIVQFDENVQASLAGSDVTVVDLTNVPPTSVTLSLANYNISTNTATFNFSPALLPNGNFRATLLASGITDFAGNQLDGNGDGTGGDNYVYDFFFLNGDANRDRIVDIVDLGIIGTNWQLPGKTWAQGDFNGDSLVDIVDLGIIGTNWQMTASSAPWPLAPQSAQSSPPSILADEQILQHRRIHRPDIFSRRPIRLAGSRR
jgi:hypothetical protein